MSSPPLANVHAFLSIVACAALFACSPTPAPPAATPPPSVATAEGSPAIPMVSAAALKDRIAAAKGKVLVINFWATWCPPCINEMPELAKFYSAYKDKLVFISISADHPETIEKNVRPFLAKMSLPFPIEVVSEADPGIVSETLGIENWVGGLPATFVYDAAGILHKEWYEEVTQETLRSVVDPLL